MFSSVMTQKYDLGVLLLYVKLQRLTSRRTDTEYRQSSGVVTENDGKAHQVENEVLRRLNSMVRAIVQTWF